MTTPNVTSSSGNATTSWSTQYTVYPSDIYGFRNLSSLPYGFNAWNDTPVFMDMGLPTRFT
jgi:hypothetical protein